MEVVIPIPEKQAVITLIANSETALLAEWAQSGVENIEARIQNAMIKVERALGEANIAGVEFEPAQFQTEIFPLLQRIIRIQITGWSRLLKAPQLAMGTDMAIISQIVYRVRDLERIRKLEKEVRDLGETNKTLSQRINKIAQTAQAAVQHAQSGDSDTLKAEMPQEEQLGPESDIGKILQKAIRLWNEINWNANDTVRNDILNLNPGGVSKDKNFNEFLNFLTTVGFAAYYSHNGVHIIITRKNKDGNLDQRIFLFPRLGIRKTLYNFEEYNDNDKENNAELLIQPAQMEVPLIEGEKSINEDRFKLILSAMQNRFVSLKNIGSIVVKGRIE